MENFATRTASLRGASPFQFNPSGSMESSIAQNIGSMQYTQPSGDVTPPAAPPPTTAQVAGDALHQTADVITGIIHEGNETQREQLRQATALRIAEINANNASISDPILRQQNAQQAAALSQVIAALNAATAQRPADTTDNTKLYIGLGAIGLIALLALFYTMTRKNPSEPQNNPVIGTGRNRNFVPMHELERRARKRARRRAAA